MTRARRRTCSGLPQLQHRAAQQSRRRRGQSQPTTRCSAAAQVISALHVPPARDIAAMLVSAVGAVFWVKLFDYFARHDMIEQVSSCVNLSCSLTETWKSLYTHGAKLLCCDTKRHTPDACFDRQSVFLSAMQKLSRKLVHITAGPLFLLTWPLFSGAANARLYAAVIPALNSLRCG